MVKSVTADFLNAQRKHGITYFYEVNLYRRYWTGSAYTWEVSSTDIKSYVNNIGNILWHLDTEGLNIWRVANFEIELKNEYSKFEEGDIGFFSGNYIRHKSKIEIKIGYTLSDGSTETCYIFTGFIDKDVRTHLNKELIILRLMGKEILLVEASAENVCNQVTGESIGTGDNATTVFYTDYKGVFKIDTLYADSVALKEGTDFTVANLNDKDNYATITFTVAPGTNVVITGDYKHWYKDIAIDTLVGYLLDEAGIGAGDRTIDAIVFDYGRKYKTWDTQAQFEATATRSKNLSTSDTAGNVEHKVDNLDADMATKTNATITGAYPNQTVQITNLLWDNTYVCNVLPDVATPAWTKTLYGSGTLDTEEINPAGILHVKTETGADNKYVGYSRVDATRTMAIRLKLKHVSRKNPANIKNVFVMTIYGNSIEIDLWITRQPSTNKWYLAISSGGSNYEIPSETADEWSDYHDIWITHNDGGTYKVYFDGTEVMTPATGAAVADLVQFVIRKDFDGGDADTEYSEAWIDWVKDDESYLDWAPDTTDAILTSNVFDLGAGTVNYGQILRSWGSVDADDTLTIETQTSGTSDFSADNDSWRTVSWIGDLGTIDANTVSKRYIRYKATLHAGSAFTPDLYEISFPGHMLSENIDCSANVNEYTAWNHWGIDNDGERKFYSQSSADASAWDNVIEISGTVISSTVRRYIRFRTIIYRTTASGTTPKVYKEKFTRTQDTFNIALANFSNMSVQDAIEDIAEILDYEIGIDTEGKYFFRRKNTNTSIDLELSAGQERFGTPSNIIGIDNYSAGWEGIYNRIVANYGNFSETITPASEGESSPTTTEKYGTRTLSISGGTIEIDDELDIAYGLCRIYYDRYKNPKKLMRLNCKMLPQLELADTVNVNSLIAPWLWWWGKTDEYYGKTSIFWFDSDSIPIADILCTVTGIEINVENMRTHIRVKEL